MGRRVLDVGGDPADVEAATTAARTLTDADFQRTDLRGPEADKAASQVASIPAVRAALLDFQRHYGTTKGAVLDGRDIGTIIFPDADVKLFVTASLEARTQRRYAEIIGLGETISIEAVRADLAARDEADRTRTAAPLIQAADATLLDTSTMNADQAFARALALVEAKVKPAV